MDRALRACLTLTVVLAVTFLADIAGTYLQRRELEDADSLALVLAIAFLTLAATRRALASRLAVSLLAMGMALGAIELSLALLFAPAADMPKWSVWPPRYVCAVEPHEAPGVAATGRFSTNSLGIRGAELPDDDSYRVLCVGGSTTECFYLDDARAWPAVIERELTMRGRRTWLGNVGRSGLNTVDHITLLGNWSPAAEMDCWLVLCGVNDMGQQLAGAYPREKERTWRRTFGYRRPGIGSPWERPLFRNMYTFVLADRLWDRIRHGGFRGSRAAVQDAQAAWFGLLRRERQAAHKTSGLPDLAPLLAEYEANLRQVIELARQYEVRLVLLTQPTLWRADMPAELEALCWAGRLADGRYRTTADLTTAMDAYNQRLREVCREEGVELVDLAASLPPSTDTFYDDCHFNDAGAERVAQLVAAVLDAHPERLVRRRERLATADR